MKKRVLSLFSLCLLVLPIAAGCQERKEQVNVLTSIVNPSNVAAEDVDYEVYDCARVLNGGTYDTGDSVKIKVEVNTAACRFYGWVENGVELAVSGSDNVKVYEKTIHLDANSHKDHYVQAIVATKNPKSSKYMVNFTGIYYNNSENLDSSKTEFPILNVSDKAPITYDRQSNSSFDNGTKLTTVLTGNENADLNYIYQDNELQPYQLSWRIANVDENGMCISSTWRYITVSDAVVDHNMCLMAELIPSGENKTLSQQIALSNLSKSEIYMSTNEEMVENIVSADKPVSSQLFYAYNIGSLYEEGFATESLYYAMNDLGHLERVKMQGDGSMIYTFCRQEGLTQKCDVDNVYSIVYNASEDYSQLAIKDLLEKLKSSEARVEEITYFYDPLVNNLNIKSIKFEGMEKYYVAVIASTVHYNAQTMAFPSSATSKNAAKYSIEFNEDTQVSQGAREILLEELNLLHHSIQKHTGISANISSYKEDIEEYLLKLIYEEINNNPDLKTLKNYIFTLDIDMQNYKIKIQEESAIIDLGAYAFAIDKFGLGKDEYNICPPDSDANKLMNCTKFNALSKYVVTYLTKTLEDLYSVKITNKDNKIVYEIKEDNTVTDLPVEIVYDASTKTFTMGDISLQFITSEALTIEGIKEIKLEDPTILGMIEQVLKVEGSEVTITTKLNDTPINEEEFKVEISKLYEDLKSESSKVYYNSDNDNYVLCVQQTEGVKMYIMNKKEQVAEGRQYEIIYGENENPYIVTLTDLVSSQ